MSETTKWIILALSAVCFVGALAVLTVNVRRRRADKSYHDAINDHPDVFINRGTTTGRIRSGALPPPHRFPPMARSQWGGADARNQRSMQRKLDEHEEDERRKRDSSNAAIAATVVGLGLLASQQDSHAAPSPTHDATPSHTPFSGGGGTFDGGGASASYSSSSSSSDSGSSSSSGGGC